MTANYLSNTVSVLLGNGDGTFQSAVSYATGSDPGYVAVGDLTGNGKQDLVVVNDGDGTVSVLLGNGNGMFQTQQTYAAGSEPSSVAIADLNGDGIPDLVVSDEGNDAVSVLLGNGNGTFQAPITYTFGSEATRVEAGDLNGDGAPDIAVSEGYANSVAVLLHTPDAPITIDNGATSDISAASASTVTFTGATGTLDLAKPSIFTGEIVGFTGTARDAAHSDVIDLSRRQLQFRQLLGKL